MESQVPYEANGSDQVTPVDDWQRARTQGYLQYLPESGFHARLRPVTPDILIKSGRVPDLLTPLVIRMLYQGVDKVSTEELYKEDHTPEQAQASIDLMNLVCECAFVEPAIGDDPESETTIMVDDIPLPDRAHVLELCIRGAELLKSFRFEPDRNVEPIPDSQEQPMPAK